MESLVKISNLKVSYGKNTVLDGLNLSLSEGEVLALVGGSGCGKSTVALSILRLLGPQARIERGRILYKGIDLLRTSPEYMRKIRGKEISIIFQEPLSALNPVFSLGYQIEEMLRFHNQANNINTYQKIIELLSLVGIPSSEKVIRYYPHQLSGGMRQRAVIAMSLSLNPKLIIADEPTSNLDVTLQVQILDLFRRLKEELGLSILLITHDLGIVENLADRICVIHGGRVIEEKATQGLLAEPREKYTKQLIEAAGY